MTPSRIAARRNGAMRCIKRRPTPRAACNGKKSDKQAAIEEIDCEHAAHDVRSSHAVVTLVSSLAPISQPAAVSCGDELADRSGISQAEIETLRADRRHDVGRLTHERNAAGAEACRDFNRKRESTADGLQGRSCPGSNASAARFPAPSLSAESAAEPGASLGSTTKTRLERCPGSGTSVKGPVSV